MWIKNNKSLSVALWGLHYNYKQLYQIQDNLLKPNRLYDNRDLLRDDDIDEWISIDMIKKEGKNACDRHTTNFSVFHFNIVFLFSLKIVAIKEQ